MSLQLFLNELQQKKIENKETVIAINFSIFPNR